MKLVQSYFFAIIFFACFTGGWTYRRSFFHERHQHSHRHEKHHHHSEACHKPKQGLWQIVQSSPIEAFNPQRLPERTQNTGSIVTSIANVTLTKSLKNVYSGTGVSEEFLAVPRRIVPVQLVGVFDYKTCLFSGTLFNNEGNNAATFRWHAGGARMEGRYVATINGTLASLFKGNQVATFLG